MSWPMVRLSDLIAHVPRPVEVQATEIYREIGIRSHGNGIFHKLPISGLELGNKKVFRIEPGDFVLNIVFAWEGAIAIAGSSEEGMIGSHRFPVFRPKTADIDLRYLQYFLHTQEGLELLLRVSPGGAGRNRTLSKESFLEQTIPLPSIREQQHISMLLADIFGKVSDVHRLMLEREMLFSELVDSWISVQMKNGNYPTVRIEELLRAPSLNGLSNYPSDSPPGIPILRISAATSDVTGKVNEEDFRFLNLEESRLERYILRSGDLLACRFNGNLHYVGKFALYTGRTEIRQVYPDKLIRFRFQPIHVMPEFVPLILNSSFMRPQIEAMCATTAGNIGISASQIKSVQMPLPPLHKQQEFVRHAQLLQIHIQSGLEQAKLTKVDVAHLRTAILTHAMHGKLQR